MLRLIMVGLIVVIAGILIYAGMKSNILRIERSATIRAPQRKVHALIYDLHKWRAWSPFVGLDPNMRHTYRGKKIGVGAVYEWQGKERAGSGCMEIVNATPDKIILKLDIFRPWEAHYTAEFLLDPRGDLTRVTWAMHGYQVFGMRLAGLFTSLEKNIGKDFEKGLENLKTVLEGMSESLPGQKS